LCASRATGRTEATAMHTFLIPQPPPEDTDSEASSDATESDADESKADGNATERATNTESNADGNATERATKKRRIDEATKDTVPLGAAKEHTDYLEDCGDEAFPQVITAIAYCLLPMSYCLLPVAYCLLTIAYCLDSRISGLPGFRDACHVLLL